MNSPYPARLVERFVPRGRETFLCERPLDLEDGVHNVADLGADGFAQLNLRPRTHPRPFSLGVYPGMDLVVRAQLTEMRHRETLSIARRTNPNLPRRAGSFFP